MNAYEQAIMRKGLTESHLKILKRVSRSHKVLEVGPSVGHMSRWLKENNECYIVGIEIDPDMATKAMQCCSKMYTGSIEDKKLLDQVRNENGLFDYILFADVLEHLVNPEGVLLGAKELLGAKGKILASVPNVAHFSVRARLLFGQFNYTTTGLLDRNHIRFFTKKTIIELFRSAGYEVTDFDATIRGLPFKPFWRLFPGLFGYQFIIEGSPVS